MLFAKKKTLNPNICIFQSIFSQTNAFMLKDKRRRRKIAPYQYLLLFLMFINYASCQIVINPFAGRGEVFFSINLIKNIFIIFN